MNAQEYISSGLLEAYVAGALNMQEHAEVEAAIRQHHEVAAEVTAIEEAMWKIAEQDAVAPPLAMQERLWEAIQNNNASDSKKTAKVVPFGGAPVIRKVSFAQAASIALLLGSLAVNYFLWSRAKNNEAESIALHQQVDTLQKSQQALAADLDQYHKKMEMMADPGMQSVVLQTTQKDHPMAAMMYWNKEKGEGYVAINKMPVPVTGKQYQLWALVDGKPFSLGVLSNEGVGKEGILKVTEHIPAGQAFAISLEKEGGVPSPTMDQIFVLGKVSS